MSELNIVFLDRYSVHTSTTDSIAKLGHYTEYSFTEDTQILERCKDADIVIANKTPLKAETLKALPRLKLVCIAATGMNNIDLEAAEATGITVKNAINYSTHSVAEATFCSVLALMKQTLYYDNYVKSGKYSQSSYLFDFGRSIHELYGKSWGIIGLGNIGRQVAQIATAFGCKVSYYSTTGTNQNSDYEQKDLNRLLLESDIISVHAPLNRNTYHLIDYHQFSLMKHSAFIINVARGSIINEEGLARALNDNLIAGAGLDVFSHEPMKIDNPLNTVKDKYKLLLSPHTAWASEEALQALVEKVAENIHIFITNQQSK